MFKHDIAAQQLYGVSIALRASREPEDAIVRALSNIIAKARAETPINETRARAAK